MKPTNFFDQLDHTMHTFKQAVHTFCEQEITPLTESIEQNDHFPNTLWTKLGQHNLLGLTVDATFQTSPYQGYLAHILAMEAISYASPAVGLSYAAHTSLCVDQINRHADDTLKKRYLPGLIRGETIGAVAVSEQDAGSDVMGMQLLAQRNGDHFVLDGHKMWITNGPIADVFVVYAKAEDTTQRKHLSAFLVEKNTPGFYAEAKFKKLGMHGSETCQLTFNRCRVPSAHLLGQEGYAKHLLMTGLDYERMVLSAGPLGIMQRCLNTALNHITQRQQFGQHIGQFQLIQAKIADMYTSLNTARSYVYLLAKSVDISQQLSRKDAASAILYTSEQAVHMALQTIQCLGAQGYMDDSIASRLLRDAKLYEIGAGTCEIRRLVIGSDVIKQHSS